MTGAKASQVTMNSTRRVEAPPICHSGTRHTCRPTIVTPASAEIEPEFPSDTTPKITPEPAKKFLAAFDLQQKVSAGDLNLGPDPAGVVRLVRPGHSKSLQDSEKFFWPLPEFPKSMGSAPHPAGIHNVVSAAIPRVPLSSWERRLTTGRPAAIPSSLHFVIELK